jgi:acetyl esterase
MVTTDGAGKAHARRPRWRGWLRRGLGGLLMLVLVAVAAFNVSSWLGALLIRYVFESGAGNVKVAMEAHAPTGVASMLDQQYRPSDDDAYLDVYYPESASQTGSRLPTLIWTHGGAWISGHRADAAPYCQLVAAEGYTVVSIGYSIAPEHHYPRPIHQVNDALAYVQANADHLHIDLDRIVMAGDSAGAQITSQYAALITNPTLASEMAIDPALEPAQLRGVILFCGIYDLVAFMDYADITKGLVPWGIRTALWAYTGSRDSDSTALKQMSTINHATASYPPALISGGNGDRLTDQQSRPFASRLEGLEVNVTTLFFPDDHEPSLPHEYQFNLDGSDGQDALRQVLAFLQTVMPATDWDPDDRLPTTPVARRV